MRTKIVTILRNLVRDRHIHGNGTVVLEMFADELIKQGATFPVHCHECKHCTEDGFCYQDIALPGYKKTHIFGYCDKGEKKNGKKT